MYTFLIIDDEPIVREGISANIDWQSHGFRLVGTCRDGREGLRAVEETHPDVVLTDICMPFVDGLELAAFISERYPATKTIILTGYDEFEYAQEAVKLKVSDFLLKPITPDEIRALLDRVRAELDQERRKQQDVDKLRQQLRENLPLLREGFFNRLIEGEVKEPESSHRLSLLELNLPGPAFNVLAIDADWRESEDDLATLAIRNAVDEVSSAKEGMHAFHGQRDYIVVLLSAPNEQSAISLALEFAEELSDRVRQTLDLTVSIGIGSPVRSLDLVDECYRDARTALEQRLVLGPNQIITAEQARGSVKEAAPHAEEIARANVVRMLKSGTDRQTEAAVHELVTMHKGRRRTIEECHVSTQRLLADLLNAFERLGIRYHELPELADDPFGRLRELKSLSAIEHWFYELQKSARAVLARRQQQHSVAKAIEAEEYIAEHFGEPGLSLTILCRALAVSKSYFSPMFKRHSGMTFVEYLTNVRIERAKELLGSTDMKSYEVAWQVGFADAHYFSLTFRKQTGVSPTEYRESVRGLVG